MLAHGQGLAAGTASRSRSFPPGAAIRTWEDRLAAIGCPTVHAGNADNLAGVPGFAGSIVVGMCNSHVMACRGLLKDLGCRLVWVNCMTFLFDNEIAAFRQHGPAEAFVFQSEFQRAELEKVLPAFGYNRGMGHIDPRGLCLRRNPVPARGRTRRARSFVIGRLARPDLDKWSSNHWQHPGPRALRPAAGAGHGLDAAA